MIMYHVGLVSNSKEGYVNDRCLPTHASTHTYMYNIYLGTLIDSLSCMYMYIYTHHTPVDHSLSCPDHSSTSPHAHTTDPHVSRGYVASNHAGGCRDGPFISIEI